MGRETRRIALLYRGPQQESRDEFTGFVPVGLFHVLKSLLQAGYCATLHNLSELPAKRLKEAIGDTCADAVLISAFYGAHHQALLLARTVKQVLPKAPVVLGGPVAVLGESLLRRTKEIDFIIRGEGEEATVRLLDALFGGDGQLAAIGGLIHRHGHTVRSVPPELLADLDRFAFLPSEVLPHCHQVRPENLAVLISSRGCPYRCAFCSSSVLWQNRVRHHQVGLLIDYLKDLRRTTGALYFSMRDENFLVDRCHVQAFCQALEQSGLHYLWNAQGSPHLIDDEMAGILAGAGCDQVQMGIETVSPRLQQLLAKRSDAGRVREACATLRRQAIRPFGYFIYGMGETDAEARDNCTFIKGGELLDAVVSPLVLYPGTSLAQGVAEERFFGRGEVLYFDPASRTRLQPVYEAALRSLLNRAAFRRKE
ncbi:MAG: B12-binding domain-containing radical SAM protein, partial [Desulfobulbaceae bacterium]|nr:B12-binding domain-containing radical SAM protein [Desulfobulbaceae bacterium]